MRSISEYSFDIGYMDTLAAGDSFLHRLDPRAKLITTAVFIVGVVSLNKYALSALTPFFIFPLALLAIGGLPARYFFKKVLLVSPFAIIMAIFNPLMDRSILVHLGPVGISGGWISFLSIMTRFILTVLAALILVASTGFNAVCRTLTKLGVPRLFVVQLLFFYRYLFVLAGEADRMVRARALRSFNARAMDARIFVSLLGHLLLRTLDRAERIYRAMYCRGFDGTVRLIRTMSIGRREIAFTAGWIAFFIIVRCLNIPVLFGGWVRGVLR
jgi:cobalt ABC transporter, permease protein CbiQ